MDGRKSVPAEGSAHKGQETPGIGDKLGAGVPGEPGGWRKLRLGFEWGPWAPEQILGGTGCHASDGSQEREEATATVQELLSSVPTQTPRP